jgi:hypothetical protein
MPSALFEIYQKNFEKSLKRLSESLELYQKQPKEIQSITLKETELNISEMERAISQMEFEVIIEKIPDNKKKLNKIIEANKNIVKQYKREIQDLKYKDQSILNKKNLAKIPLNKKKQKTELNFLKDDINNKPNNFMTDDEDIALFINKNSNQDINIFNNGNFRDEVNLKKDFEIKRINDYRNNNGENNEDNIVINNTNDLEFLSNFSNYNGNINVNNKNIKENNKNKNNMEDKDSQDNKYKKNKNNFFTNLLKIIINIIHIIVISIYKGFIKLKNYLHRKYGYNNAMRIMIALFIILFIMIYALFVYLFASKPKIKENTNDKINIVKNNSFISENVKKDLNNTGANINETNIETKIINDNNSTNISIIKKNDTSNQN